MNIRSTTDFQKGKSAVIRQQRPRTRRQEKIAASHRPSIFRASPSIIPGRFASSRWTKNPVNTTYSYPSGSILTTNRQDARWLVVIKERTIAKRTRRTEKRKRLVLILVFPSLQNFMIPVYTATNTFLLW